MKEPERLLAVNLNYLGDALFTTPALAALRARFPKASIDVMAGERAAAIIEGVPGIDRLLVRPPRGGTARAVSLARTLKGGGYDGVILFQSILSNAVLAWAARVPLRIGFAQDGCGPFLTHAVAERGQGEHIVDAYLRLAGAMSHNAASAAVAVARPDDLHLSIAVSPADAAFADAFFHAHEIATPVVGLVIGATRPQKRWPEEYWARLSEKLWSAAGVASVLLGGPEETEAAERIKAQTRSPLVSAVGQTTAKELAALVARLNVVVSGDSGPLHIATAMGTPVVALFGSTDPAETGPWGPQDGLHPTPATVLYDALDCAPCRKTPTCNGRFDCLRVLTPERVYDAACALLGIQTRRPLTLLPGSSVAPPLPAPVPAASPVLPVPLLPPAPVSRLTRPVRSILVLTKYRFMGDTVVAVPLLRATRQAFPAARISLLTGPAAATVLEGCPFVDSFIRYDPYNKQRGLMAFIRMMRSLRRRDRPDLCLVADRSFRSAIAACLCGGRVRAGFDSEGRGKLLTHPIAYDGDGREIECYLEILRAVAPDAPENPYDPMPQLWVTPEEREQGARILAEREAIGPLLVGIQPGASYPGKQWDAEKFAAVADALADACGAGIVLVGGPGEEETARKMRQAMKTPCVDLTGATKLRQTMGVLSHLSLFIGNDTGVNHIAGGLGIPTVALFGPTPANKWGNVGPQAAVLIAEGGDLEKLPTGPVIAAATELLRRGSAAFPSPVRAEPR